MSSFGKTLLVLAQIGLAVIWLLTAGLFFARGDVVLALIALFIPPADIVLPWLISPTFGIITAGTLAAAFIGAMLAGKDN